MLTRAVRVLVSLWDGWCLPSSQKPSEHQRPFIFWPFHPRVLQLSPPVVERGALLAVDANVPRPSVLFASFGCCFFLPSTLPSSPPTFLLLLPPVHRSSPPLKHHELVCLAPCQRVHGQGGWETNAPLLSVCKSAFALIKSQLHSSLRSLVKTGREAGLSGEAKLLRVEGCCRSSYLVLRRGNK